MGIEYYLSNYFARELLEPTLHHRAYRLVTLQSWLQKATNLGISKEKNDSLEFDLK